METTAIRETGAEARASAAPSRPAVVLAAAVGLGVAVAVDPMLGVLAAAVPVLFFVTVRHPDTLLHVLAVSVFVESVGFGSVRVGRVLAVGVLLFIAGRVLWTSWRPPALPAAIWLPAAGFALWSFASVFWSPQLSPWAEAVGELALAASYLLAFALFVSSGHDVRLLLRTYTLGAVAAAAWGFAQAAVGERSVGLQGDPNLYALYQVAAIPAAVALAKNARGPARAGWLAVVAPLAGSVLASQSRGGLLTLAVVAVVLAWREVGRERGVVAAAGVAVLAVAALAVTATTVEPVADRLSPERIAEDRGSGRADVWNVAWYTAQRHPILGIGAGQFEARSLHLLQTVPGVELDPGHHLFDLPEVEAHNVYLETLAEVGVVGLALFVGVMVAAARVLASSRFPGTRAPAVMLLAFALGATFLSVANNKLLWMLVGSAAALHRAHSTTVRHDDARTVRSAT